MKHRNLLLRYKLQFFAADTGSNSGTADDADKDKDSGVGDTDQDDNGGEDKDDKTFTQAEIDKMIADRLKRATKNQPTKEELKAFKDWQETQKTEEQKTNDKISAAEKARLEAEAEANTLKAEVSCLKQGVNAEYVDDVVVLAQRLVTDDVTIDDAIKQVVKKYPHFATTPQGDDGKPNVTTSTKTKGDNKTELQKLEEDYKNPAIRLDERLMIKRKIEELTKKGK